MVLALLERGNCHIAGLNVYGQKGHDLLLLFQVPRRRNHIGLLGVHVVHHLQGQAHENDDLPVPCSSHKTFTMVDTVCVCVSTHEDFCRDHWAVEEQTLNQHHFVVTCVGFEQFQSNSSSSAQPPGPTYVVQTCDLSTQFVPYLQDVWHRLNLLARLNFGCIKHLSTIFRRKHCRDWGTGGWCCW